MGPTGVAVNKKKEKKKKKKSDESLVVTPGLQHVVEEEKEEEKEEEGKHSWDEWALPGGPVMVATGCAEQVPWAQLAPPPVSACQLAGAGHSFGDESDYVEFLDRLTELGLDEELELTFIQKAVNATPARRDALLQEAFSLMA